MNTESESNQTTFPLPARRLRLGMVGGAGGFIGPLHADGARLSGRWEIVAGALSSDPRRARDAAANWNLPSERAYASYKEMAMREAERPDSIDAVAITTPNASHHEICVAFLERGFDIICDKPLTTNLADALDLVERQRRAGVVLGVPIRDDAPAARITAPMLAPSLSDRSGLSFIVMEIICFL